MKLFYTAIYAVVLGLILIVFNPVHSTHLLGAEKCTWGPKYWCSNITNAQHCKAVRHCIQTVWEKQVVPEDNDSVCQICLDMVKQARDELESNDTQENLKAVFEGSCKLIPLNPIQKECIKLADDFIPELIDALASQMNPQVVCSVAGLCNNARIDQMLAELQLTTTTLKPTTIVKDVHVYSPVKNNKEFTCTGCNNIATMISNKFHSANRDDVLEGLLHFCGKLSSFSDACSNIMISYFEDIYDNLKMSMNSEAICHISGVCSSKYHQHPELVEIRPLSNVGVVNVKDDIPCELCEQLVQHLRELLIANTTETEFKQVLEGLCKQTTGFKKECLSIVDQYYDAIYNTLINDLDANGVCFMIGICPKGLQTDNTEKELPIAPLLPSMPAQKLQVTIKEKPTKKLLGEGEPQLTNEQIQSMQLPIDRIIGPANPEMLIQNGELCTLCEYFLHFVQEALSSPANEDKIKQAVFNSCKKLPTSIRGKCDDFVDLYGDAVIALLIQEIDPSQVCPMLKICPSNIEDMEVFSPQPISVKIDSKSYTKDKPTCPLCLFAVQQAEEMIKSNKTEENIKHALNSLCSHLPNKLRSECDDFVETYSSELVQMLITDFTPQQICVYLRLCEDNIESDLSVVNIKVDSDKNYHILTNEISDNTVNGVPVNLDDDKTTSLPECVLCQKIIKEAEKKIINPKSEEQVKDALEHACDKIINNRPLAKKCHEYVEKHGDIIANLILKELTPKMICRELGYCVFKQLEKQEQQPEDLEIDEALKIDVVAIPSTKHINLPLEKITGLDDIVRIGNSPSCVICEFVMAKLEHELQNKTTQDEIKDAVLNICKILPKTIENDCDKFIANYANLILNLLGTMPPKEICGNMMLCQTVQSDRKQFKFNEINDEVVSCGVCHGATIPLVSFIKNENYNNLETQRMIEIACENLPAKYYEKCSHLISYYGESIINLTKFGVDQSQICSHIGKCFEEEQSKLAYLRLEENDNNGNRILL